MHAHLVRTFVALSTAWLTLSGCGPTGAESGYAEAAPDVDEPPQATEGTLSAGACQHSLGGLYANRGCSASYQCCDGGWRKGVGSCAACACSDPTGTVGCSAPTGASCTHSFGGVYADTACSGSYQCCDGKWKVGLNVCGTCLCSDKTGKTGCGALPAFTGTARPIPADVVQLMKATSWRAGCPVPIYKLSLLEMSYVGFDGAAHKGRMIVATHVANQVLGAFKALYDARYPINKVRLVEEYGASDAKSMADNNTSAFNCRKVAGTTKFSQHSYGTAIDINPVQNPWVRGTAVDPPAGAAFVNRSLTHPAIIRDGSAATAAFDAIGWGWGGRWGSPKDYQHFSANGY